MFWLLIGYMWLFIHRPFEVWPKLGEYHVERAYMIVTLLYWAFVEKKVWNSNRLNFAFFCLALSILLSTILSPYDSSINPIVEDWLKIGVFYVLIMSTVRDERQLRLLVIAFLVVMSLYVGHSFREFLNGRHFYKMSTVRMIGVDATMNDPNTFGASVLYSLPIVYPLWYEARKRWQKMSLIGYVLLACGCIFLTGSRSSLVGLALLSIFTAGLSKHRFKIAIGLAVIAPLIWCSLRDDLKTRYWTLIDPSVGPANAQESAEGRTKGWWDGVQMWKKYPLLGVGPGSFPKARGFELESHHLYGQIIGEIGTVGALAFTLMIGAFYANYRQAKRLAANNPIEKTAFEYRVITAVLIAIGLLLFEGFAGHNLYRFTWLWYGAFQALALRQLCLRHAPEDCRFPLTMVSSAQIY